METVFGHKFFSNNEVNVFTRTAQTNSQLDFQKQQDSGWIIIEVA
jgi:hypothetical protein